VGRAAKKINSFPLWAAWVFAWFIQNPEKNHRRPLVNTPLPGMGFTGGNTSAWGPIGQNAIGRVKYDYGRFPD